jgi:hypothetical protein
MNSGNHQRKSSHAVADLPPLHVTRLPIPCQRNSFNRASTKQEWQTMKNPLDSLWGTIISGVILTAILYYIVKNVLN